MVFSILVGAKVPWALPWLFVWQEPFGTSWFWQIWSGWHIVIGPTDVNWNSEGTWQNSPPHDIDIEDQIHSNRLQWKSALKPHRKGSFAVLFNKNTVLKFQNTQHKHMLAGEHSGSSIWSPQSRPLRIWLKAPQRLPGVNGFWKSSASFPTLHGWKRGYQVQSLFCTFEWTPIIGSKGLSLDWDLLLVSFFLISFLLCSSLLLSS